MKATAQAFGNVLVQDWQWQRGDVICMFSPNDADYGPCVYGALYVGGTIAPANPGYGAKDLAFMLKDAGAKVLMTHKALLPVALEATKLAGLPQNSIILMGADTSDAGQAKHFKSLLKSHRNASRPRPYKLSPDEDLAFLAYSSGTTGLPKGVMLSHRNIIADVLEIKNSVGNNYSWKSDKLLGVLPFFHIYGLTGLVHQPLNRGLELVIMPQFQLDAFCKAVQDHKITFTYVAPPVLVQLSRGQSVQKYDLTSLRMITCGAAPLTKELVSFVHSKLKLKVNQAYGLSETSPMTHTQVSRSFVSVLDLDLTLTSASHGMIGGSRWAQSASCFPT